MISIAIKDNDNVVVGIDSVPYTAHSTSFVPANMNIFTPKKAPNTIVCYTGGGRIRDLIVTQDDLIDESELEDGKLTCDYIMKHTFPLVCDLYYKFKILDEDDVLNDIGGNFVFAKDDTLIVLDGYGNIRKVKSMRAVGQRADFINSLLSSTKENSDPIYRILKTFLVHSETGLVVYPICIKESNNLTTKTYTLEETAKYVYDYETKEGIE